MAKTAAKRKPMDDEVLRRAHEMVEADVDYRTFHNTFFAQDSELLVGKSRDERSRFVKSPLYKKLTDMSIELGVAQGYLSRDSETGETHEKRYSGTFVMRVPSTLHRQLVLEARREGVSLNQLCAVKLAKPLG